MNKLRGRLVFDLLITALLVFEMFFQLTGDFLHEVVGVAFFVTVIVHLALSHKWIKATSRSISQGKKLKAGNKLRMAFGIAMGITTLVLAASSLLISNQLFALTGTLLAGAAYSTWVTIHTVSSYTLCALVAGHVIMHWASVAAAFRIPYNRERRAAINAGMTAVAVLGMAAIGSRAADALSLSPNQAVAASTGDTAGSASAATEAIPAQDLPTPSSSSNSASGSNSTSSSSPFSSTSSSGSASTSSSKGSRGRSSSSTSSSSAPSTSNSNTPSANSSSGGTTSNNSSSGTTSGSNTVTGTCTLCHKNCPLSSPQCNKPYAAGLI